MKKLLLVSLLFASVAHATPNSLYERFKVDTPQMSRKVSFKPLPLEIYFSPNNRPAVLFTTPCLALAGLTNTFPPAKMFEIIMFTGINKLNDSEALPISLEPICI
jgi:hypothetical protein